MKEFRELQTWLKSYHEIVEASSLPEPTFVSRGKCVVSFSTNNYLSLATSERLIKAAFLGLKRYGVGNCESRLLGGDLDIYRHLEAKLAALKKKDSAVIFATGYLTNVAVLSGLVNAPSVFRAYGYRSLGRHKCAYFTDEYNHISIREGIRMSEAERVTYRHSDLNHLESGLKNSKAAIKIIVSDGVFSMDGHIAPLRDLVKLADLYDAIVYIDDAHGTGVLGATGGGISEHFNVYSPRIIHMGTLSKAYGAIGGFVATESYVSHVLRYASTAYGFTSTIPPDQAFAVSEAMDMVKDEPIRLKTLWKNQRYFVSEMEKRGFRLISKETPIVPVLIGDEALCNVISVNLREQGFHVDPVKFPAVPKNQSRLRFVLNAGHKIEQIDRLVAIMSELAKRYPQVINADRKC